MSIVIVAFTGAPIVSEEAIKKEQELDNRIEAKIKGNRFMILSADMTVHMF
jgi:hypothetical protein